jgi:hypothetical protein
VEKIRSSSTQLAPELLKLIETIQKIQQTPEYFGQIHQEYVQEVIK